MQERGEVELQAEVVLDLGRGEGGIVPVKGLTRKAKFDGLSGDPAREGGIGERVPREALPSEEGGG